MNRWKPIVISACFAAGLMLGGCAGQTAREAVATASPTCEGAPWHDVHGALVKAGWRVVEMPEEQRRRFLANFNNTEPKSAYAPNHIYIAAVASDADNVMLQFATDDCMTDAGEFSVGELTTLLSAPGQGI